MESRCKVFPQLSTAFFYGYKCSHYQELLLLLLPMGPQYWKILSNKLHFHSNAIYFLLASVVDDRHIELLNAMKELVLPQPVWGVKLKTSKTNGYLINLHTCLVYKWNIPIWYLHVSTIAFIGFWNKLWSTHMFLFLFLDHEGAAFWNLKDLVLNFISCVTLGKLLYF